MTVSEPEVITRLVPNPVHQDLVEFLARVNRCKSIEAAVLNRPNTLMVQGHAWTGTQQAPAFAEELQGRKDDLPTFVEELADAVRDRMAGVPEMLEVEIEVW